MKNVLRTIGDALVMGLTWAVVWAPVGPLVGLIVDRDGSMDEPWIVLGVYPGFLSGLIFFTVLRIAKARRLEALPLPRSAAWGALSGLLLPVLFALFIAAGGGTVNVRVTWTWVAIAIGTTTLLGAVAGSVSRELSRRRKRPDPAAVF